MWLLQINVNKPCDTHGACRCVLPSEALKDRKMSQFFRLSNLALYSIPISIVIKVNWESKNHGYLVGQYKMQLHALFTRFCKQLIENI